MSPADIRYIFVYVYVYLNYGYTTLSELIFVVAMKLLNHKLRKSSSGYKLHESQEKINYLMYMDVIKLFTQNRKRIGNPNTG